MIKDTLSLSHVDTPKYPLSRLPPPRSIQGLLHRGASKACSTEPCCVMLPPCSLRRGGGGWSWKLSVCLTLLWDFPTSHNLPH